MRFLLRATPFLGVVALVSSLSWPADAGGKLDRVRDATSSNDDDDDDSSDDSSDDSDDDGGGFLGALLRALLFSGGGTETGEASTASDYRSRARLDLPSFVAYPYADGHGGNLRWLTARADEEWVVIPCPPNDPHCVEDAETCFEGNCYVANDSGGVAEDDEAPRAAMHRFQLSGEFGADFDGLERQTYGLWLESVAPVGVEGRFSYWREPLAEGGVDELFIGDGNVVFRVATLERLQAHLGVGGRFLFDGSGAEPSSGFNATVSLEAYPLRPLTLRGYADAGNLGPALFLEGQATLGVMLDRFELFAGYSGMRIGPVPFHGPLAGLRLHL